MKPARNSIRTLGQNAIIQAGHKTNHHKGATMYIYMAIILSVHILCKRFIVRSGNKRCIPSKETGAPIEHIDCEQIKENYQRFCLARKYK